MIILTTFDLDEYAFSGLKAGASGFMLKDVPPGELLAAIRSVHSGDAVVAPSTTRRLLDRFAPMLPTTAPEPQNKEIERLTEREREVMLLVAQGLSNGEIAARLVLVGGDGEDPRGPHPDQAGAARPGPGRGPGVRDGPGPRGRRGPLAVPGTPGSHVPPPPSASSSGPGGPRPGRCGSGRPGRAAGPRPRPPGAAGP